MNIDVRIRPAAKGDAPALADLSGQLGYPTDAQALSVRLEDILRLPDQAVLVADAGGRAIGWVHVAVHRTLGGDPEGELLGLVVDAPFRGGGVGGRLMQTAERWIVDRGLTAVRLRSRVHRVDAHRFYERLGYARLKEQVVLRKSLASGGS